MIRRHWHLVEEAHAYDRRRASETAAAGVPAVSAATGHDGVMSLRLQLVVAVVLAVLAAFNIVAMFNMKPSYGAGSTARATADQRVVGVNAVRGVRCVSACDRSIAAR